MNLPILIVEDDPCLREAICDTLELSNRPFHAVDGGKAALKILSEMAFSIVISDVRMMPMDGLTLLKKIREKFPYLPVVLMTAYAEVEKAVEAMKFGACEFLLKPFEPKILLEIIKKYELQNFNSQTDKVNIVDISPSSKNMFAMALRVAQTDATILLTGESGTGKEVVARFIHQNSNRHDKPFIAINCAAIPENLLEATLFGYEKGAFTGANTASAGKFEQAQDGTLLLDEITEMPLNLQSKLLRILQEKEVERIGGKKTIELNVRVIATSNRDMLEAVKQGIFREDLYYRLSVFPIQIPALRERKEDIVAIAKQLIAKHSGQFHRKGMTLSEDAQQMLINYDWKGNVRELENVIQRALILSTSNTIEVENLNLCMVISKK